jgi:FKBP-type peptidyl-prolyl cis-trans isomerase FklB
MKKSLFLAAPIFLAAIANPSFAADKLATEDDKISYSIGVDIGKHFRNQNISIKKDSFLKGVEDGQTDAELLLSEQEIKDTLLSLQAKILERQNEERNTLAQTNLKQGQAFLDQNKSRSDVKTTDTGLQYQVITEGNGTSPKATDRVTTHYRGTLIDGTEFDSSYSRGEPMQFAVNGVIPGWTEALQMMKPGAKWQIWVPPTLAYGEHGVGNVIGPNATLIFEIELLEIDSDNS